MIINSSDNIWDIYHSTDSAIVIPTNIGWKTNGANPMGVGMAKAAADIAPNLPYWYGGKCKKLRNNVGVLFYSESRFLLFPTKPLNDTAPHLSWQSNADINLIRSSVVALVEVVNQLETNDIYKGRVLLPMVGTGAGQLPVDVVLSLLNENLDDRFVLFSCR